MITLCFRFGTIKFEGVLNMVYFCTQVLFQTKTRSKASLSALFVAKLGKTYISHWLSTLGCVLNGSTFDTHHDLRIAGLRQLTRSVMMFVTVTPTRFNPLSLMYLLSATIAHQCGFPDFYNWINNVFLTDRFYAIHLFGHLSAVWLYHIQGSVPPCFLALFMCVIRC